MLPIDESKLIRSGWLAVCLIWLGGTVRRRRRAAGPDQRADIAALRSVVPQLAAQVGGHRSTRSFLTHIEAFLLLPVMLPVVAAARRLLHRRGTGTEATTRSNRAT